MNLLSPELTFPEGRIGPFPIGGKDSPFVLVAGPCVIESLEHCIKIAEYVKELSEKLGISYIFKASFDKANRSSIHSYRGPGLEEGLKILDRVKREVDVAILTDIHLPDQANIVAEVADVIQIPAFLARQTDLLLAAAKTGRAINVKKAQFMSAWEMRNVVEKLDTGGAEDIILTERGNFFGYNRWVVDMRNIEWMHQLFCPVLIDATHSVADPGGEGSSSGGDRRMAYLIARAGVAAGADGLFLEVHDEPTKALSDKATVLPLNWLESLLQECQEIYHIVRKR